MIIIIIFMLDSPCPFVRCVQPNLIGIILAPNEWIDIKLVVWLIDTDRADFGCCWKSTSCFVGMPFFTDIYGMKENNFHPKNLSSHYKD